MSKKITFDRADIIKEHEKLTKLLNDSAERLHAEYIEQTKELKQYKKGGSTKEQKKAKVKKVMHKYKNNGKPVKKRKQSIVIALPESNKKKIQY